MLNIAPLLKIQRARLELAKRKNHDYSGRVDNVSVTRLEGIAVRLYDKAARILSLVLDKKGPAIKTESIRDTLVDAGNYADFGVALLDDTWKDVIDSESGVRKERRKLGRSRRGN